MVCVATVITWLWFCRAACSHKVSHLSGLYGYWWYRGIIHIQSTEANTSFTQVDGWVSLLQVSPVRRLPDEGDGWRKASFFAYGLVNILHCMIQWIYIFPLLKKVEGLCQLLRWIGWKKEKKRKRKNRASTFLLTLTHLFLYNRAMMSGW